MSKKCIFSGFLLSDNYFSKLSNLSIHEFTYGYTENVILNMKESYEEKIWTEKEKGSQQNFPDFF